MLSYNIEILLLFLSDWHRAEPVPVIGRRSDVSSGRV
jgi:hypothetical protein